MQPNTSLAPFSCFFSAIAAPNIIPFPMQSPPAQTNKPSHPPAKQSNITLPHHREPTSHKPFDSIHSYAYRLPPGVASMGSAPVYESPTAAISPRTIQPHIFLVLSFINRSSSAIVFNQQHRWVAHRTPTPCEKIIRPSIQAIPHIRCLAAALLLVQKGQTRMPLT